MKKLLLAITMLMVMGCSSKGSLGPTSPSPTPIEVTYAINVPDANFASKMSTQFPDGYLQPPVEAQRVFDFRSTYWGAPNVYYGETAPPQTDYYGVGITVAPLAVASKETFYGREWQPFSNRPDTLFEWVGRFAYAKPCVPLIPGVYAPPCA